MGASEQHWCRILVRQVAVALGCFGLFCSHIALGQASAPYLNVDQYGVDVVTGRYHLDILEGRVGPGDGGIELIRHYDAGSQDNWSGTLTVDWSGGGAATVVFGRIHEKFVWQGGGWVNVKANGGTLTGSWTYRAPDGTVISYATPRSFITTTEGMEVTEQAYGYGCTSLDQCGLPVSIQKPNGLTYNLDWQVEQNCFQNGQAVMPGGWYMEPTDCYISLRLQAISNTRGYSVGFGYQSNTSGGQTYFPPPSWYTRNAATFSDGTVVTYATPSSTVLEINNSQTGNWRVTRSGTNLSIRKPGRTTDTLSVTRDSQYRVTSLTDDGVTRTYSWGTSGGNTVVNVGGGATGSGTVTSSPSVGQPGTVTNAVSATVGQTYDSNNRELRTTFPEGNYIEHTRDARGNITQTVHQPKSGSGLTTITTSANFDTVCNNLLTCNQPNYTIDGRGNRTDYTYNTTHGQITRIQLPAPVSGQPRPQVDYSYTALTAQSQFTAEYKLTQVTACATAATCAGTANETKVTIAYNTPKLLTSSVTVASGSGSISATTAYTYDADDNVASIDGPLAGADDTEYFFHDAQRRPIGAIGPDPDGSGGYLRPATRATYDSGSRIIKLESGTATGTAQTNLAAMTVLRTIDTTFDGNGRKTVETLKGSDGVVAQLVQYSYDTAGRLECTALRMNPAAFGSLPSSACSLGTEGSHGPDRITKLHYDAAGRPIRQESGVGTLALGNDAAISYTLNGKTFTATDGENNTTTYEYDGFDRLAKLRLPVTTQGAGSSSTGDYEQYTHDANGNVLTRRTRAGETLFFAYDALNRLTSKIVPERSGLSSTHTRDVYYIYDLLGRLKTANFDAPTGEGVTANYDALGRMVSETRFIDGVNHTVLSGYDAAGNRTSLTHPDGNTVDYYRDAASRLYYAALNSNPLFYPPYNADGTVSVLYRWRPGVGWATSDGYTDLNHDTLGRLSNFTIDIGGSSYDSTTYFSFNPASQINSTARTNDAYAWTGGINVDRSYTANGLNQYSVVAGTSFGYDTNGNLTSDGTHSYTYDVENRLVGRTGPSTSATLRYDPLGRLYETVGSDTGTTRFLHDGSDLVAEYDASGNLLRRYVHGPSEGFDDPLVWFEGSGLSDSARRYLFADERGSIVAVTDASGNALYLNKYDEYGIPDSAGNDIATKGRFRYTGQAYIPELGLYYYKARMYSPTLGRFMQTDPIGYADGMNMYAYVGGDPVNFADPSGMCGVGKVPVRVNPLPIDAAPNEIVSAARIVCMDIGIDTGGSGGSGGEGGGSQKEKATAKTASCLSNIDAETWAGLGLDAVGVVASLTGLKAAWTVGSTLTGMVAGMSSMYMGAVTGNAGGAGAAGFATSVTYAGSFEGASRLATNLPVVGVAAAVGVTGYDAYQALKKAGCLK